MNGADHNRQSLVFADGYSYTEIFLEPEMPGTPGSISRISVFHAFLTDHDSEDLEADPSAAASFVTTTITSI